VGRDGSLGVIRATTTRQAATTLVQTLINVRHTARLPGFWTIIRRIW
jgi:hypothetical protein